MPDKHTNAREAYRSAGVVITMANRTRKTLDQGARYEMSFLALFGLRKFILQICMRSHPTGLDVWFLL